ADEGSASGPPPPPSPPQPAATNANVATTSPARNTPLLESFKLILLLGGPTGARHAPGSLTWAESLDGRAGTRANRRAPRNGRSTRRGCRRWGSNPHALAGTGF